MIDSNIQSISIWESISLEHNTNNDIYSERSTQVNQPGHIDCGAEPFFLFSGPLQYFMVGPALTYCGLVKELGDNWLR